MKQREACVGREDTPAIVAASRRFSGYKPETEHPAMAQKVEPTRALAEMKIAWAKCVYHHDCELDWDSKYPDMLAKIRDIRYSAQDIEAFSIALAGFQNMRQPSFKAGLYLSALINNCDESMFAIHSDHLGRPLDCLGYRNRKEIVVEGSVGREVGFEMEGGAIIVKGDAGHCLGEFMRGGSITVEGDAGAGVGSMMRCGRIIVNGDAGERVGEDMGGGEIHLNGGYGGIFKDFGGGRIFHKGTLIAGK
jgi:hypothetical protein